MCVLVSQSDILFGLHVLISVSLSVSMQFLFCCMFLILFSVGFNAFHKNFSFGFRFIFIYWIAVARLHSLVSSWYSTKKIGLSYGLLKENSFTCSSHRWVLCLIPCTIVFSMLCSIYIIILYIYYSWKMSNNSYTHVCVICCERTRSQT